MGWAVRWALLWVLRLSTGRLASYRWTLTLLSLRGTDTSFAAEGTANYLRIDEYRGQTAMLRPRPPPATAAQRPPASHASSQLTLSARTASIGQSRADGGGVLRRRARHR